MVSPSSPRPRGHRALPQDCLAVGLDTGGVQRYQTLMLTLHLVSRHTLAPTRGLQQAQCQTMACAVELFQALAFERQRDFAMGQYGNFNSILGNMPNVGQVRPSTANPYTAALSGAMMGAGFGGNIYDYFSRNRQPAAAPQPLYQNSPYAINSTFEPAGF